MNKKLLVVAIGAAVAAPAFAQSSNVTLYGRVNTAIESAKIDGSDSARINRVQNGSSRLGVRGVEDLGGGLKAVFGIEAGLGSDAGGTSFGTQSTLVSTAAVTSGSATAVSSSGTASVANNDTSGFGQLRNAYVGLDAGSAGRLVIGRLDLAAGAAPMYGAWAAIWNDVNHDATGATAMGDAQGQVDYKNSQGLTTAPSVLAAYNTNTTKTFFNAQRVSNAIGYSISPMANLSLSARYAANGFDNSANITSTANSNENSSSSTELGAIYKLNALTVSGGYQKIGHAQSATANTFDARIQLGASYDFGVVKVGGHYAQNKFDNVAAGTEDSPRELGVSAAMPFGKNKVIFNYGTRELLQADEAKRKQMQLGYNYNFSTRTMGYAYYDLTDSSDKAVSTTAIGSKAKTLGLGVRHNF